ncbi:MAG: transglycosylase SLT domain-containing protein [Chroococcidiopsidaceae cyanobacterium CP_BM_RX_35]|nr:transglycosylase SLT domain-containing protein [Chroococcidiopsidaceae cyanobacterium CP_BM_RX_35]
MPRRYRKKTRRSLAHNRYLRQRRLRRLIAFVIMLSLCGLLLSIIGLVTKPASFSRFHTSWNLFPQPNQPKLEQLGSSTVFALATKAPMQRTRALQAIAQGPDSQDRNRARYLLAIDSLQRQQGAETLKWLDGLEYDYPVLAPYIVLKRALGTVLLGDKAKAIAAWQDLLDRYPESPVAAEALWELGKTNLNDWQQILANFPSHPRLLEMVQIWLKQNPQQPQLMVLLAKYAFDSPSITTVLDQLVNRATTVGANRTLLPEDWEAVAKGYWENRKYGQASAAYARASHTPQNAYLSARALQLAQQPTAAFQAYRQVVQDFPKAPETANALLQIAQIESAQEAVPDLDQVVDQFPNRAGEALATEVTILTKQRALLPEVPPLRTLTHLTSDNAATLAQQLLLTKYGTSDAAAALRWQMAQAKAKTGDLSAALQWAKPIMTQNPNSLSAREAGFGLGKWAQQLGQQPEARTAWTQVLTWHPQSYYAWRSAVALGCNVGNFTDIPRLALPVVLPTRSPLPSGSAMLQELYLLGQDQDVWTLWEAEFQNRLHPTVVEQFTDGLLRQGVGDYLTGIAQVSQLEDRDTPSEQLQYQSLKQKLMYWQALYPLPFADIIQTWSTQRQLNPLLVVALIRQESQFMPQIRSAAGATGLMQVKPEIAAIAAKRLGLKSYALDNPNENVNLGTWLLDSLSQQYKNNILLTVASYNAGGKQVVKWQRELSLRNPDRFVEAIPFAETKDYVKQVFGNYWNYWRLYTPQAGQQIAKCATLAHPTKS